MQEAEERKQRLEEQKMALDYEVRTSLPFFSFKISKPAYRFAGDVDPNVLCCAVGVADQGSDTARVEDAIKILTRRLRHLLAFGDFECAGIDSVRRSRSTGSESADRGGVSYVVCRRHARLVGEGAATVAWSGTRSRRSPEVGQGW
jgi:hypothetical protein